MTTKKTTKRAVKKVKLKDTGEQVADTLPVKIVTITRMNGKKETLSQEEFDKFMGIHEPDAEATVEQINTSASLLQMLKEEENKTNYWKYACIAILLGIVTAMIFSTPLFVKTVEVCSQ